jgi:hypothetical protein
MAEVGYSCHSMTKYPMTPQREAQLAAEWRQRSEAKWQIPKE